MKARFNFMISLNACLSFFSVCFSVSVSLFWVNMFNVNDETFSTFFSSSLLWATLKSGKTKSFSLFFLYCIFVHHRACEDSHKDGSWRESYQLLSPLQLHQNFLFNDRAWLVESFWCVNFLFLLVHRWSFLTNVHGRKICEESFDAEISRKV